MKKLNKDYVLFATMHDVKEDSYVSFERVALKEVPDLEAGNTKPLNAGDGFADYSVIEMRLGVRLYLPLLGASNHLDGMSKILLRSFRSW